MPEMPPERGVTKPITLYQNDQLFEQIRASVAITEGAGSIHAHRVKVRFEISDTRPGYDMKTRDCQMYAVQLEERLREILARQAPHITTREKPLSKRLPREEASKSPGGHTFDIYFEAPKSSRKMTFDYEREVIEALGELAHSLKNRPLSFNHPLPGDESASQDPQTRVKVAPRNSGWESKL